MIEKMAKKICLCVSSLRANNKINVIIECNGILVLDLIMLCEMIINNKNNKIERKKTMDYL